MSTQRGHAPRQHTHSTEDLGVVERGAEAHTQVRRPTRRAGSSNTQHRGHAKRVASQPHARHTHWTHKPHSVQQGHRSSQVGHPGKKTTKNRKHCVWPYTLQPHACPLHMFMRRGWASVLNTYSSSGIRLGSENRRYRYFRVSARKKESILSSWFILSLPTFTFTFLTPL